MANNKTQSVSGQKVSLTVRLARIPAWGSCALLVFLMLFTTADVMLRYLFNAPIYGGLEISESAMLAMIMLAMAYTGATNAHVRVDVLDTKFGHLGQRISNIITGAIALVVLWFLVERTYIKTLDAYEFGDVTNFLQMPIWPLYAIIALGMAGFGLVIAAQIVASVLGRTT